MIKIGLVYIGGNTSYPFQAPPPPPLPNLSNIYGVEIDLENSNPETAVTYTDDAIGFTPMRGNNGNFSWGSWEAVFGVMGIKPCLLKNGAVQYYLNPNDFGQKEDGSPADIESGNSGNVMIEFPRIYWKIETVGDKLTVQYSMQEFEGSVCHAHMIKTTIKDKIYIGAFLGNDISSKTYSLSGKAVTGNKTISASRTAARANGSGYQQMCYYPLVMLQVLYLVWFKDRDSQTALGRGFVDDNAAATVTGGTISKGMFYGETTGKQQVKFCGIEDFWGNCAEYIDGFYSDSSWDMLISDQSVFHDTGSGYINRGQGATANVQVYVKEVQGGNETAFVPRVTGGSATTYFTDLGYLNSTSIPLFGGGRNSSSGAGVFAFSSNIHPLASGTYHVGRLTYIGTP